MATVVKPAVKAKLVLPTQKSSVDNRWISQKTVVIGPPGIGKSEFFSHGEKTLYVQTEAGLNHLSVMKVPITSWEDFRELYTELIKAKPLPYDTIVIDTVDKWVDLANAEIVDRGRNKYKAAEINVIGDIPNGAGWAWSTDLVENALAKLEQLDAHIVLIGHLDRKEVKKPNNVSMHLQTISIGGKTGRAIISWPDHLLNIEAAFKGQDMVRTVRTFPTSTIDAKSRGGMVPNNWAWDSDSKVNYTKFRSLFQ